MFLMYVDESGDPGMRQSPTRYFVLSGLVLHEIRWSTLLDDLIEFRRRMRQTFGLKLREEIHAAHFVSSPGELKRIPRNDRLTILRHFADEIARLRDVSIINVVVDKAAKPAGYDPYTKAWEALLQRFENTMAHRNFRGPNNADERGMVFPDGMETPALRVLMRKMRRYNPVPSRLTSGYRNLVLTQIVEDPSFRRSDMSYFIQAADLCAFVLYQFLAPNSFIRAKGATGYLRRLEPVLCKSASPRDPLGIVRL
jgi:hypothetical protein